MLWVDTCEVTCAAGPQVRYRATIRAYGRQDGHFTQLTVDSTYRHDPMQFRMVVQPGFGGKFVQLTAANQASAPTRLPTDLGGSHQLEVRPSVVEFTGDSTGLFGGFTGQTRVRRHGNGLAWAGRIHWSVWNAHEAKGTGAAWLDNGIPDDASGTFSPHAVSLRASRSTGGVFTALAFRFSYEGKVNAGTLKAHQVPASELGPGYWAWPGG